MIPDDACTTIPKVRKEKSIVLFQGKKESKSQNFQSLVKNAFQQIKEECTGPFFTPIIKIAFHDLEKVMAHHMYVPSYNFLVN